MLMTRPFFYILIVLLLSCTKSESEKKENSTSRNNVVNIKNLLETNKINPKIGDSVLIKDNFQDFEYTEYIETSDGFIDVSCKLKGLNISRSIVDIDGDNIIIMESRYYDENLKPELKLCNRLLIPNNILQEFIRKSAHKENERMKVLIEHGIESAFGGEGRQLISLSYEKVVEDNQTKIKFRGNGKDLDGRFTIDGKVNISSPWLIYEFRPLHKVLRSVWFYEDETPNYEYDPKVFSKDVSGVIINTDNMNVKSYNLEDYLEFESEYP